jgi:CubicO group peptidase (beta-lactamase class C family)
MLREAVEWVVSALAGEVGSTSELAPRLAARGDVAAYLTSNRRFAAFREGVPVIEEIRPRGEWAGRAIVVTGEQRWEVDVAIEPEPPHRILSFQPRPVAGDAVGWESVRERLRAADHRWSGLGERATGLIDRRLAAVVDEQHLVGMVAGVAVGGEVVYRGCFGVADLESDEPVRAESVFRVGSVTKLVTALAVLRLAAGGVIDLEAPLAAGGAIDLEAPLAAGGAMDLEAPLTDGLEPLTPEGRLPTAGELLVHRGGLPKDAAALRLAWEPGERAEYSNLGYGLLGRVVARAAGMPFTRYCTEEILGRYGLGHTTMQERGAPAPADVTGYRVADGRVAPAPPAVAPLPSAGGMTADLDDLLALTRLFSRGEDPLARAAISRTTQAGPGVRFAPGFAIVGGAGGEPELLWRGGATDGFTAEIVAALDGSCDVVLLASKSPPEGLRDVARDLVSMFQASST